jgi:trimeric autotransporter adhesin
MTTTTTTTTTTTAPARTADSALTVSGSAHAAARRVQTPQMWAATIGTLLTISLGAKTNAQFICSDPAWNPFDPVGMNSSVSALSILPNGDIVAGGNFTTAGGVSAHRIARWDGTSWFPLGAGMDIFFGSVVSSLLVLTSGDLIAGGNFSKAGDVPAKNIARWNGASWSALGGGTNGTVHALAELSNGDLIAGGSFGQAGGKLVNFIARWNGNSWFPLATGGTGGPVYSLMVLSNGDLIVGGSFSLVGGVSANGIVRWNGSTWSALGQGVSGPGMYAVYQMAQLPNGDLIAAGKFDTAGLSPAQNIARWNGSTWSPLGASLFGGITPSVRALAVLSGGELMVGGAFANAGILQVNNVAIWNGSLWSQVGSGTNGSVGALIAPQNDQVVVGGGFTAAGGLAIPFLARYGCPSAPACYPDCDASGSLTIDDFICFQTLFAIGDPAADCDASGGLSIDDFICFQTFFAIGC